MNIYFKPYLVASVSFLMPSFSSVKWGLIVVASATMGLFALGMFYALKKGNITINSPDSFILVSDLSLPTSLSFSSEHDTPHQNYTNSWIGATIDFAESTYRSYGIRSDNLNSNSYMKFDGEFYERAIKEYYNEIKDDFVAATFPKILDTINDLRHAFLPKKYCSVYNCSNLAKVIQQNPCVIEPIDYKWASSVSDIKQLLSEAEQPLLMSIPEPITKIYLPCSDHRVICSDNSHQVTCPPHLKSYENCSFLTFPSIFPNAEFYKPESPAVQEFGNPITFLLYGWNDDFVNKIGNFKSKIIHPSVGGFLIKRSYKLNGNALGYYDGSLLFQDNDLICGKPNNPQRWKKNDILKCINKSLCDTSYNYSIYVQENGEPVIANDKFGMTSTKMCRYVDGKCQLFDYDLVPYYNLDFAFNILNVTDNTDPNICGYWFLPYDVVEQSDAGDWLRKRVHAINFATKWSKSSFQKKNEIIEQSLVSIETRNSSFI